MKLIHIFSIETEIHNINVKWKRERKPSTLLCSNIYKIHTHKWTAVNCNKTIIKENEYRIELYEAWRSWKIEVNLPIE